MELCSNCILPKHLPGVSFDEKCVCNYCNAYKKKHFDNSSFPAEKIQKSLEKILRKSRGKGDYDCLIPLSGGKDSTYLLYLAVKKYNMKVLAVNFDNGFRAPQAVKNIENAVNKLGVDLIVFKLRQEIMLKLFRTFLIETGEFCTPCNMAIGAITKKIAKKYGIRTILTGNSRRMSAALERISPAEYYDRVYFLNVINGHIPYKEVKNYIEEPYIIKGIKRIIGSAQENVATFEYLNVTLDEIKNTLINEVYWKNPSNRIEHGDCLLDELKNYIMYKRWGISEVTGIYSALVRSGQLSREAALEKANAEEATCPINLQLFLKKTTLTESEFNEALNKDFRDIPNIRNTHFFRLAKIGIDKMSKILRRR